jgi:hypothetical protein
MKLFADMMAHGEWVNTYCAYQWDPETQRYKEVKKQGYWHKGPLTLAADFVFNSALGRVTQLVDNVEQNSPAAAVLRMHAWVSTQSDDTLNNEATIADVEAVALTTEATNSGYVNQVMDETDITITVNDTTNLVDIDLTDQTFTSVSSGDNWTDITISYDGAGTDTDSATLVLTWHDFVVSPNGGDITAQPSATGFYRAT